MSVKAIIFDLGGVIIDLGFDQMVERFEWLGVKNFGQHFTPENQGELFEQLELGLIEPAVFYEKFREMTKTNLSDETIEEAWNLILKDFQKERMDLLTELSAQFSIYLFSNTNAIHAKRFEQRCIEQMGRALTQYFTATYYSHDLHLRKPTVASFKEVLRQAGLSAHETLFIDDNAENIKGAKNAGLQTYHLKAPEQITMIDFTQF